MDGGGLAARFFLDEDGVGAGGERGAGGDAYRLARADAAGEGVPGGALTDQAEGAGKIGVPDRITVHRREVGGGMGAAGVDGRGRPAAGGVAQDRKRKRMKSSQ